MMMLQSQWQIYMHWFSWEEYHKAILVSPKTSVWDSMITLAVFVEAMHHVMQRQLSLALFTPKQYIHKAFAILTANEHWNSSMEKVEYFCTARSWFWVIALTRQLQWQQHPWENCDHCDHEGYCSTPPIGAISKLTHTLLTQCPYPL